MKLGDYFHSSLQVRNLFGLLQVDIDLLNQQSKNIAIEIAFFITITLAQTVSNLF